MKNQQKVNHLIFISKIFSRNMADIHVIMAQILHDIS